jgi:outer membrane autotransporter protein
VRDALFESGGAFARRHGDALANRRDGFGLWASLEAGDGGTDGDEAGPGNHRDTQSVAGGISFRLSDLARLGLAAGYESTDARLHGTPETGDVQMTEVGAALDLRPGIWRIRLTASHGWGEIAIQRGSAAIGGIARADYGASLWSASAETGPELTTGDLSIRPFAAIEWSRATTDAFAEDGSFALQGAADGASRLAASLGAEAASQWDLPGGSSVRLWANARVDRVVDGRARDRAVAFAADPDGPLLVTSASEGSTHTEGRAGISLFTRSGLGLHLGATGRTGGGDDAWRATAGISATF